LCIQRDREESVIFSDLLDCVLDLNDHSLWSGFRVFSCTVFSFLGSLSFVLFSTLCVVLRHHHFFNYNLSFFEDGDLLLGLGYRVYIL